MSQMSEGRISPPERGGTGARDLEQLADLVAENAGSPLFPALAETHRFAGRLDEARRVAEAGLERAPENAAGSLRLSTQVTIALSPPAIISRESASVAMPQIGKSGDMPLPASVFSRCSRSLN